MSFSQSPLGFTATPYSTGSSPVTVAVGAFRKGGDLDLAITNAGSDTVSILWNNGDGTFQPGGSYPTGGRQPHGLVIADFNNDGILDLAITNFYDGTVGILFGKGDGTFGPASTYYAQIRPQTLAAGDFNGDGYLDLAIPNSSSNNVTILLNQKDGTFSSLKFSAGYYFVGDDPQTVAVGDLTGNGMLDLVVANQGSNSLTILFGNGNGTFGTKDAGRPPATYQVVMAPNSVAVSDFNGDGILDLAFACSGTNQVGLLFGDGNGNFSGLTYYSVGKAPQRLAVGEITGSGFLDILVPNSEGGSVNLLLGQGNGAFAPILTYGSIPPQPYSIAIGDFNRDGYPDFAVVSNAQEGIVNVMLQKRLIPPIFGSMTPYSLQYRPTAVAIGDFRGNGILDLAVSNYQDHSRSGAHGPGYVSLFTGRGDGTFAPEVIYSAGAYYSVDVIAADLDANGKLDLAISDSYSDVISVLYGNGDGTFSNPQYIALPTGASSQQIAAGKFDANLNLLGLAIPLPMYNQLMIYPAILHPSIEYLVGKRPYAVAVGTFRKNASSPPNSITEDVVVTNQDDGTITILLCKGDLTFEVGPTYQVGSNPCSVAVGDLNGDGILDIVVTNQDSNDVSILFGNGDGTFQAAQNYQVGKSPRCVALGDMTGNGALDIVTANADDRTITILMGYGDGTFVPINDSTTYPIPTSLVGDALLQPQPLDLALGDFNGDGQLDIAVVCHAEQSPDPYSTPPKQAAWVNEVLVMLQSTNT